MKNKTPKSTNSALFVLVTVMDNGVTDVDTYLSKEAFFNDLVDTPEVITNGATYNLFEATTQNPSGWTLINYQEEYDAFLAEISEHENMEGDEVEDEVEVPTTA